MNGNGQAKLFNCPKSGKYRLCIGLFFIILILCLVRTVNAETYYVNNNCSNNGNGTGLNCAESSEVDGPFNSIANMLAKPAGYLPGDIIDGLDNVYYERLVVPNSGEAGNIITFQNFILDGTVSFDDSWTFNPANTYSSSSPWVLYSGEIYSKWSTRNVFQLFEDGVKLTPIVTTDSSGALNLSRGQFTNNNNTLYYRASDGRPPADHAIRVSRRDLDGLTGGGLIYSDGKNHLKLHNVTVKNFDNNSSYPGGISINNGDHITLDDVNISNNGFAILITSCTNVTITSSCEIADNIMSGIMIQGNSSDLDISGSFNNNGRHLHYDGSSLIYAPDGDNIGIGGIGGNIADVTIHDATVTNAGAPDGDTNHFGSGIYIGTSYPMSVSNLNILRSRISGNHNSGVSFGTISNGFFGGNIIGNLVYKNSNYDPTGTASAFGIGSLSSPGTGVTIANNVFALNPGNAGLYLNNSNVSENYTIINNSFYNNGRTGTFRGDLWISQNNDNINESNNNYFRSGTGWDDTRVIERNGVTFDINHILGTSSGYWQFASDQGLNDIVGSLNFLNPNTGDYLLTSGSVGIDAGAPTNQFIDYAGNPIYGLPDIGAYEYQPPYTMGADKPDIGADVRVYGGGKFRDRGTKSGEAADLAIIPGSTDTSQWLNVDISQWEKTGTRQRSWTEASGTITGNVAHSVGELEANKKYNVSVDGSGNNLTGCLLSHGNYICTADGQGKISFTYTGTYSTHTFSVQEGDNSVPAAPGGLVAN